ncbi:MAG: glycosyltransferase [Christiangramia sp.]
MPKLLVIGHTFPEPSSTAAGTRMLQLLDFFLAERYEIFFGSTAARTERSARLSEKGIGLLELKLNDSEMDEKFQALAPDVVLFDRFMTEEQFGWKIDENCPRAMKILDTEDLHFLRAAREQAYRTAQPEASFYFSDIAKREISAMYRCDLNLIISRKEWQILKEHFSFPKGQLYYLPFLIEPVESTQPGFTERKDFMSIGNFLHKPNRDAVIYLKENLWKPIRQKLPEANLYIYGAYPDQKILALHDPENGFLVQGHVEDAFSVFRKHKVLLAPLRFGAGLKGKFFDAMQTGTPSITFPVGAEGIAEAASWPGKICQDTEGFVKETVALYQDQTSWEQSVLKGEKVLENFRTALFSNQFRSRIHKISAAIEKHRSGNFTGEMMKFHLMRSTRFLSKYIEIKNKKTAG